MKRILILLSLIAVLASCEKHSVLKTGEVIPGGCNLDNKGYSLKGIIEDSDKVTWSTENGNLKMFVGFNTTCCGEYSASFEITDDLILIKIKTITEGMCNCICYYTYEFTFTGTGENYSYMVTVDDRLTFTGKIKN